MYLLMQAGIEKLPGLRVLYMSNNRVREWGEIEKLAELEHLEELLLLNNPVQTEGKLPMADYRIEVRHTAAAHETQCRTHHSFEDILRGPAPEHCCACGSRTSWWRLLCHCLLGVCGDMQSCSMCCRCCVGCQS